MLSPRSLTRRATPSLLAPHQRGRPPEHRQVNQHDLTDTMTMRSPFAARRPLRVDRDHDAQPLRPLADTDHTHRGQADQQRAHARSIRFQAGAPRDSMALDTVENHRAPAPRPGSPPQTDVTTSSHPQIRSARYRYRLGPKHGDRRRLRTRTPNTARTKLARSAERHLVVRTRACGGPCARTEAADVAGWLLPQDDGSRRDDPATPHIHRLRRGGRFWLLRSCVRGRRRTRQSGLRPES